LFELVEYRGGGHYRGGFRPENPRTEADSFPAPAAGDLLIRLTAAMGHQAEYRVPAGDLPAVSAEEIPAPPQAADASTEQETGETTPDILQDMPVGQALTTPADLEQLVERAVARQLGPIRRALEQSQSRQRLSDVVGGIGYIIGLMGVVLYFHSRRGRK